MKTFKVTIEGVTPLLCNAFTDMAQLAATSGTRSAINGDKGSPKEQATTKLYMGRDGRPMIPGPNLFRSVIDAGKFHKAGKSKVTTQKSSLIPACVSIPEIEITIQTKDGWSVDTRPVRIPSTGGRILAHRPCFHDWKLEFTLELDDSMIGSKLLRQLVDDAGQKIGLGDFRPDNKGPFGKFKVTSWDES